MKKMNLIKKIVATGTVAALGVSMLTATAIAGSFVTNETGIWYQNDDGTFPAKVWKWIDADGDGQYQCFAFDENGYLYVNATTPDGYTTDANGSWIKDGVQVVRTALESLADKEIIPSVISKRTEEEILNEINKLNGVTNETAYGTTTKDTYMTAPAATSTGIPSTDIVTKKHTVTTKSASGKSEQRTEPDVNQACTEVGGPSVPTTAYSSSYTPTTDTSTQNVVGPDGAVDTGADEN